jgi:hypothetical protein
MIKGYPQKQFILKNDNLHAVKLLLENGTWRIEEKTASFLTAKNLLLGALLFLAIFFIIRIRFSPKTL